MQQDKMPLDMADNGRVAMATATIVSAVLDSKQFEINNMDDIGGLVSNVRSRLMGEPGVVVAAEPPVKKLTPAEIKATIKPDYLVCLEDGKHFKMLKRHLRTEYDMSPDEYRAKWGLPYDYPMTAPGYTEVRRELAVKIGLGRKPGQKRGRRKKAA